MKTELPIFEITDLLCIFVWIIATAIVVSFVIVLFSVLIPLLVSNAQLRTFRKKIAIGYLVHVEHENYILRCKVVGVGPDYIRLMSHGCIYQKKRNECYPTGYLVKD